MAAHGSFISLERALIDYVFLEDRSIELESILQQNADVNYQRGQMKHSCLHGYAAIGECENSKILLKYNANPNLKDAQGKTPAHLASQKGYLNFIKLMLENGWQVNSQVCFSK